MKLSSRPLFVCIFLMLLFASALAFFGFGQKMEYERHWDTLVADLRGPGRFPPRPSSFSSLFLDSTSHGFSFSRAAM